MPVTAIYTQPATDSIMVSMRPIILTCKTALETPMVFCDIYISGTYTGSLEHTVYKTKLPSELIWQFDIRQKVQEYFSVYFPRGTDVINKAGISFQVLCKFRDSTLQDGIVVPEGPEPVQPVNDDPPVPGGGIASNSFWCVHATIQHESNLNAEQHLAAYRNKTWREDAFPLSHRPDGYLVARNKEDFFSYLLKSDINIMNIRLYYRTWGKVVFQAADYRFPLIIVGHCLGRVVSVNINFNSSPMTAHVVLTNTHQYRWSIDKYNSGEKQPVHDDSNDLILPELPSGTYTLTIYPWCEADDEQEGKPYSLTFQIGARPTIWKPDYTTAECQITYADYKITDYDPATGSHNAARTFDDSNGNSVLWRYQIFCSATGQTKTFLASFAPNQLVVFQQGQGSHCYTSLVPISWTGERIKKPTGYSIVTLLLEYYTDVEPNAPTGNSRPNVEGEIGYVPPAYLPEICPPGGNENAVKIQVRVTALPNDICSKPFIDGYIASIYSDIAPGVVVFKDLELTQPMTGYKFIMSNQGPDVYVFNQANATVQYKSGTTC